jgi:hypothetical protein
MLKTSLKSIRQLFSPHSGSLRLLSPGARFVVMALTVLPAIAIGVASGGTPERVGGVLALGWFALLPLGLYQRWATLALPVVAGTLLMFTVFSIPFNSAPFVVYFWTAAVTFLLSLPRRELMHV